jgi:hypothetical protein
MARLSGTHRIAKIVSIILHPFVVPIPTFAYLVFFYGQAPLSRSLLIFAVASFSASFLIAFVVAALYQTSMVRSVDLDDRRDRPVPLLIGAGCYLVGFLLTRLLDAEPLVPALLFCYATNTLVIAAISSRWKISIHTTATAGPLVALAFAIGPSSWPLFFSLPLVAASRLILRKHDIWQVTAGAAAGPLFTWLQLEYLFAL